MKATIKRSRVSLWIFLLLLGGMFQSCSELEEVSLEESPQAGFNLAQNGFTTKASLGKLRLPDSTRVEVWDGGSRVKFYFPKDIRLVWKDEEGNAYLTDNTESTCSCSIEGSNCPVILLTVGGRDVYGCLQGNCEGTCSGSFNEPPKLSGLKVSPTGTFIDLGAGIHLIKSEEEMSSLPAFDPCIPGLVDEELPDYSLKNMILPLFADGLTQVLRDGPPVPGYRMVAINYYGTLAAIKLSESYIQDQGLESSIIEVTCRCNSPESAQCLLNENNGVYICAGPCSSCTLIKKGDDGNDDPIISEP